MVFSSLLFTFVFLPGVLLLYFGASKSLKLQNYILLAASLFFYAYGEPKFVFVMLCSILANFCFALLIHRAKQLGGKGKGYLIVAVLCNLGILFVFKYLNFSVSIVNSLFGSRWADPGIALPIGISFFTFQAMSYVVDVYRGTVEVQRNPFYLALYISFFPQLIAGPIVRYSTIEEQITRRKTTLDGFAEGARRFLLGFCKKILLANQLSVAASEVFAGEAGTTAPAVLWLASICYTLQIFYDFSGYSDMAIGLGRMFGFTFDENFDYPYISGSVTEFWRRWHISLGQWFRDYVYIPLGGSRVSMSRHIFNMFAVWVLTGIWHGANYTFVLWGMEFFLLLVLEKYLVRPEKRPMPFRLFWRMVTLACVNFGWVLFNSADIGSAVRFIRGMFGGYGPVNDSVGLLAGYLREYGIFLAAGILFAFPTARVIRTKLENSEKRSVQILFGILEPLVYGGLFMWAVSFLILGTNNPFIYFNF